eukprot:TRINITY_DN5073_c0_g1_i27.p1 TRINITY_DN5073_c0_g1~~TRINITY_DN5073_c0_g1_i27.p1  ORF type:complete len:177 (-),score=2.91 TRINITY_DN5073_c0_g1_i27:344-874(-)
MRPVLREGCAVGVESTKGFSWRPIPQSPRMRASQLSPLTSMPLLPTPARLPSWLRDEVDRRLREAAYGDSRGIAAWLDAQGQSVSKSALARYAARLRSADSARGIGIAATLTAAPVVGDARIRDASLLYRQMRQLLQRQLVLLDRLEGKAPVALSTGAASVPSASKTAAKGRAAAK